MESLILSFLNNPLDYPNPSDLDNSTNYPRMESLILSFLSLVAVAHKAIFTVSKESKDTKDHNETNLNDVNPVEPVDLHVGIMLLLVSGTITTTVFSEDNNKDHKDRNSEKERHNVRNLIRVHFFN